MLNSTNFLNSEPYDGCRFFEDRELYFSEPVLSGIDNAIGPVYKPLRELNLTDSFMFAQVMAEPEILKEFLQIVLGIKIHHIEMAEYEKTLLTKIDSKNIRLDIYAGDGSNRKYCVEMQAYVEYNIGRRSRYYQSTIDIDSLSKGQSYDKLSDAFVIFICTYDPFGLGMQKYIFEKRCINSPQELPMNDGVSTIILTDCNGDPEINEFFRYAKNSTDEEAERSNSKLVKLLHKKVKKVHFDPALEVEYMKFEELQREQFRNGYNSGIEQGIKQGIEQGIERGIEQGIERGVQTATFNMIKTMLENRVTDDKICIYTNCTPEYLADVKSQLAN